MHFSFFYKTEYNGCALSAKKKCCHKILKIRDNFSINFLFIIFCRIVGSMDSVEMHVQFCDVDAHERQFISIIGCVFGLACIVQNLSILSRTTPVDREKKSIAIWMHSVLMKACYEFNKLYSTNRKWMSEWVKVTICTQLIRYGCSLFTWLCILLYAELLYSTRL